VSRRSFRAVVASPRPASAWVLVTVASGSVWITQQLDPWVIVVQAAIIIATLWRRTNPFPWQSSDITLNVGMFGIVAVTIAVALRGGPSTIALAHFAALTQGLQLVDARPRRTEFLLVALSLFQVVLAANLTDSVFFTPLLLAFLFSSVWTLMVHTLRSEAAEVGQHAAASRALTSGLLRATLIASGLSALLAMLLFVMLPRLRSSVVEGPGFGPGGATAGFSDQVTLGDLGRIRQDPTVVMRIETLEGDRPFYTEAYWRGLAFDHFDGSAWSITPSLRQLVPGSPEGGVSIGIDTGVNLVQRIVREPVESGVLFGIGDPRAVQGTVRRLESDRNGGLYAAGQSRERIRYTLDTWNERPSDAELRDDDITRPRRDGDRYLQLPEGSAAITDLAFEVAGSAESDAERMRALETFLAERGTYSDTPPRIDPESEQSPVEAFLFGGMAAHCEYFASSLVLMARSLGFHARLVNGFAGGRVNRIGDFVEVTRSDAHAWVEVYYAEAGWVRYDATPTNLRARPEIALSLAARVEELGSAVELWWYQSVVGFDRSDQIHALRQAWTAWRETRDAQHSAPAETKPTPWNLDAKIAWKDLLLGGLAIAALASLVRRLSRRRRRRRSPVPAFYAEALRLLARRGLRRESTATARDFAADAHAALPESASRAFAVVTEAYLAERFGRIRTTRGRAAVQELRASLRGTRGRRDSRRRSRPREIGGEISCPTSRSLRR
jgi:transglutaminase-like putative cysteine protease